MARVLTNENNYYNIADTIRQMKNVNTTYKPREMASALKDIYSNEVEGVPPLSFEANGNNLLNYRIDGNVGGVGDKTNNLFDGIFLHRSVIGANVGTDNVNRRSIAIDISNYNNGEKITFSRETALGSVFQMYQISSIQTGGKLNGENVVSGNSNTLLETITITNVNEYPYLMIFLNGATNPIEDEELIASKIMVNVGNTALPYEPYGYKVPVVCGGTTTNIYLDEPIEENENISLSDTNVSIPTIEGTNVLAIDTTIQPSNVYIQASKDTQEMIEAKSLLQPPLKKFGANISTLNPIIDYSNVINDIYNKLPKITQSGTGLTITPVQNGQVDDFKMIGVDLEQNTTTGKNKLKPYTETTERYGITASYDENTHIYTFNGTCTRDNVTFILSNEKINFTANLTKSVTYWVGGSCTNYCDIRHFDSNYSSNIIYSIVDINSTNNKISKTSNYTFESPVNYATIRFDNGSVADNLQIKVMVTDDDNTDYEPYTGGIPSPNPDYPQDIKVVEGRQVITDKGKNLFDKDNMIQGYWAYADGGFVYSNTWICTPKIACSGDTPYTYQFSNTSRWSGFVFYDENGNYISTSNKQDISSTPYRTYTATSPSNARYLVVNIAGFPGVADTISVSDLINFQLEEGSTATNYEPYYEPVSYNIDLQLANIYLAKMPNTTYKNRIYKNNGNWYYERNVEKIILDGNATWYKYNNNFCLESITNYNRVTNIPICTHFKGIDMTIGTSISIEDNDKTIRFGNNENASAFRVFIIDSDFSDAGVLKNFLLTHNVELWYILATPVTTQITNTTLINQLEAISVHTGTNIIELSSDNNMTPQIEITRLKELEKLA